MDDRQTTTCLNKSTFSTIFIACCFLSSRRTSWSLLRHGVLRTPRYVKSGCLHRTLRSVDISIDIFSMAYPEYKDNNLRLIDTCEYSIFPYSVANTILNAFKFLYSRDSERVLTVIKNIFYPGKNDFSLVRLNLPQVFRNLLFNDRSVKTILH